MNNTSRKSTNDINFRMTKNIEYKANNINNNIKFINLKTKKDNIPQKNNNLNNTNNICTLSLLTSNTYESNNFNAFNKNF